MKPFLPFTRPSIDAESIAAVADVFRSGQLASGPKVLAFEAALAGVFGAGPSRACDDLGDRGPRDGARGRRVGEGDEVIVPAMSFAASANVVARVRAKPVFVDIDLYTRNINSISWRARSPRKTRAIMPVHFSGLPVDMDALYGIAARHGLAGRRRCGARHRLPLPGQADRQLRRPGGIQLSSQQEHDQHRRGRHCHGDAKRRELFEQYRFHGIKRNAAGRSRCMFPGAKSNLTDVAAQVGIDQLRRLDGFNGRRRELAALYFEEFDGFTAVVLPARGDSGHSWHMFQVLIDFAAHGMTRPGFQKMMADRGIGIGVHYPCIPGLNYYRQQGYRAEDTPVAARVGRETVTLPMFPAMQRRGRWPCVPRNA